MKGAERAAADTVNPSRVVLCSGYYAVAEEVGYDDNDGPPSCLTASAGSNSGLKFVPWI